MITLLKKYIYRNQRLKCKNRGGERYIQVGAPDNGRVPFPSIITIWGGERFELYIGRWETAFPCVPLHFNHGQECDPLTSVRTNIGASSSISAVWAGNLCTEMLKERVDGMRKRRKLQRR